MSGTKRKRARAGAGGAPPVTKAWIVSDKHEGKQTIVWAPTSSRARSNGRHELDLEYTETYAKRLPQLDGFTGDLQRWQWDNGWWFECLECYRRCSAGTEQHFMDEGGDVFCCPEHKQTHEAKWEAHRAMEKAAEEDLRRMHPGALINQLWVNEHGAFASVGEPLNRHVQIWEVFLPIRKHRF